ncbi:DUSK4-like protein, partial [Mya arenaria]
SGEAHIDPHHMYINCMDLPSIDLLSKFQECFDFIDEALTSPENKDGMGLDEAYATVKQLKPNIKPNPGFIEQLELFENMGCKIDEDNLLYRRYRLQVMSERVQAVRWMAESIKQMEGKVDLVKPRLLATINQPAMRNQVATNQSESANMILDQSEKNKVQMIETTE